MPIPFHSRECPARSWPQPRRSADRAAISGPAGSTTAVNVAALREMTDDSGGRTEIVRDPRISIRRRPASPTS